MKNLYTIMPKFLGGFIALGFSSQIFAASPATSTLTVTANVQPTCLISDATLAFGEYLPVTTHATADLDGSTAVSVTCTNGTAAKIYSSTPVLSRVITNTNDSETLNYKLYTDSNRQTELGITDAAGTISVTGTGLAQPINLYGKVIKNQQVTVGSYTGTANLTISY